MTGGLAGFRLYCTLCENEGGPVLIVTFDTDHQAANVHHPASGAHFAQESVAESWIG